MKMIVNVPKETKENLERRYLVRKALRANLGRRQEIRKTYFPGHANLPDFPDALGRVRILGRSDLSRGRNISGL